MTNQIKTIEKTALTILNEPSFKQELIKALPNTLSPDRMIKLFVTEIKSNPLLQQCTLKSLFGSFMQCVTLGLEPGNAIGHVYFIPFKNNKKVVYECTLIPGYKGLIKLIRQSGTVRTLDAHEIYENDLFEFEYGSNQYIRHRFTHQDRGRMIGAYAYIKFDNGGEQFEIMWKEEIDAIKNKSQSARSPLSPWNNPDYYPQMCRKTPIRRLAKYIPLSIELQTAVTLEDLADMGKQDLSSLSPDFIENLSVAEGEIEKSETTQTEPKLENKE